MSDPEKSKKVMEWLWNQMKRSGIPMPPDRLLLEGDHDLIYLYNCGFVDVDNFSCERWINSFQKSRQKDGSYLLTFEEWMDKVRYRYDGPVDPPFDPMTIREGEWDLEEWKRFVREKFAPETFVGSDKLMEGIDRAARSGKAKNGKVIITAENKRKQAEALNKYPSPRRRRALSLENIRRQEELEAYTGEKQVTSGKNAGKEQIKSKYASGPDENKMTSSKLGNLLSGSKK